MESLHGCSTSNLSKQLPILLCQENFASREDVMTGSELFFVTDDQIAIDKTLVVQKTMVLKERTLISRYPNESTVGEPIIPQSSAVDQPIIPQSSVVGQPMIPQSSAVGQLIIPQSSTFDQPVTSQSSALISPQNENLIEEVEMSSQTSFMELCSQESTEKMDACSQESVISKMDLASQENELKVELCAPKDSESLRINEARSAEGNISHKTDLKRKQATDSTGENHDVKDTNILLIKENVGLGESNESPQDHIDTDFKNHTLSYYGKNTKRFKK